MTTQKACGVNEEWRPIVNYEGVYEVSNRGRVRRVSSAGRAKAGRILIAVVDGRGYIKYILSRENCKKQFTGHELVMGAFVGERPKGAFINHKDANKTNNQVENLEYCTPKQNSMHSCRLGLHLHPPTLSCPNCGAARVVKWQEFWGYLPTTLALGLA